MKISVIFPLSINFTLLAWHSSPFLKVIFAQHSEWILEPQSPVGSLKFVTGHRRCTRLITKLYPAKTQGQPIECDNTMSPFCSDKTQKISAKSSSGRLPY